MNEWKKRESEIDYRLSLYDTQFKEIQKKLDNLNVAIITNNIDIKIIRKVSRIWGVIGGTVPAIILSILTAVSLFISIKF